MSTVSEQVNTPETGDRKKVLIIEDSLVLRMAITKFVADLGHDIVEATDGQEGLLAAQENRPDQTISDINMPLWTVSNLLTGCANPQRSKTWPIFPN